MRNEGWECVNLLLVLYAAICVAELTERNQDPRTDGPRANVSETYSTYFQPIDTALSACATCESLKWRESENIGR
jgi:hypothetical protein